MSEETTMTIEAPWGKFDCTDPLNFVKQAIAQLEYFIKIGTHKAEITREDIAGYQELLDAGSRENVNRFLEIKHNVRSTDRLRNKDVIKYMKEAGEWKTK